MAQWTTEQFASRPAFDVLFARRLAAIWNTCVPRYVQPTLDVDGMLELCAASRAVIMASAWDGLDRLDVAAIFVGASDPDSGAPMLYNLVALQERPDGNLKLPTWFRKDGMRAACAGVLRWMRDVGLTQCAGAFHVEAAARLCDEFGGTIEARPVTSAGLHYRRFDIARCLAWLESKGF